MLQYLYDINSRAKFLKNDALNLKSNKISTRIMQYISQKINRCSKGEHQITVAPNKWGKLPGFIGKEEAIKTEESQIKRNLLLGMWRRGTVCGRKRNMASNI